MRANKELAEGRLLVAVDNKTNDQRELNKKMAKVWTLNNQRVHKKVAKRRIPVGVEQECKFQKYFLPNFIVKMALYSLCALLQMKIKLEMKPVLKKHSKCQ